VCVCLYARMCVSVCVCVCVCVCVYWREFVYVTVFGLFVCKCVYM
jgi:hypothetical protein